MWYRTKVATRIFTYAYVRIYTCIRPFYAHVANDTATERNAQPASTRTPQPDSTRKNTTRHANSTKQQRIETRDQTQT